MAYGTKEGYAHEVKWHTINRRLNLLGFWVQWQHDFATDDHKYAIGLKGEKQPMGIYEGEEVAHGMVKMILSNDEHEKGT